VNLASILGSVGSANAAGYVAAKHGVVGLTKSAALEYAAQGVRVNAIGPGYIDTPLLNALERGVYDGLVDLHPVGRLGKPEEVAELALSCSRTGPHSSPAAIISSMAATRRSDRPGNRAGAPGRRKAACKAGWDHQGPDPLSAMARIARRRAPARRSAQSGQVARTSAST
jgi:hypothetical protein